jgi:hypothetical protein
MFPHRPRHAICCPSRGPSFGLFARHRWYSQRENGTTSYTCERFLVSGLGTPNLHQVVTTWPNVLSELPSAATNAGRLISGGGCDNKIQIGCNIRQLP